MTESIEAFQISLAAAETYEAMFVPALFGEWAAHTVEAADLEPGQSVLDVACGTGVVARAAADVVGPARVVGIDLNDSMLAVARRSRPRSIGAMVTQLRSRSPMPPSTSSPARRP